MVERMLKFCYGIDYSAGAHRAAEPDHISRAHTHAEMYALAEKYGMQGLKKSAKANFSSEIQVWVDYTGAATMPRFTELVSFIYDEIPASDRPLRDLVIAYAYKDWKLLSRQKEFMAFLAANFDFAFDMIDSKPSTIKEKARPVCDKPCSRCRSSEKWKLTSTRVTCDCGRFEDITHNVALA